MGFRADLHCHSSYSDGSDTPEELLQYACDIGLQGLSITDHDNIDAYREHFFSKAKELNIRIISGVEISAQHLGTSVHILGYGFDCTNPVFIAFLQEVQQRRRERNLAILTKLAKRDCLISLEELKEYAVNQKGFSETSIGRVHIAQMMLEKGCVSTVKEAFEKYIKDGACCFDPGIKFTPIEVIEKIHEANGKAIIAHPQLLKNLYVLDELLDMPFDGLEGYYGRLYPSQEKRWIDLTEKKNWIATGGSDFHGKFKPNVELGSSWVDEKTFDLLTK